MKKNNNAKEVISCCVAFLLAVSIPNAHALENDSEQEITIDSNTATYDDATATSTYIGSVVSNQGSIHVNSDQLVVHLLNGEAEKLIFTGHPAHFRQKPSENGEDIVGEALTGEYYPKKNLLVLIDNATVTQGNATYASQWIEYDSKHSVVKAGEKASSSKRVHVILKPKTAQ